MVRLEEVAWKSGFRTRLQKALWLVHAKELGFCFIGLGTRNESSEDAATSEASPMGSLSQPF